MSTLRFILLLVLYQNVINSEAAKILAYYPCPSISHQVVFRPITLELLKRGHQVTVVTADPMFSKGNAPANLTEIDVHDMSYDIIKKFYKTITGKQEDVLLQAEVMMDIQVYLFEEQLKLEIVKEVIDKPTDEYDLLLLEAFFIPLIGLTHKFSAPTILVSSFGAYPGNYEVMGVSTNPFLYPGMFRQRLYNLNMWEKITEFINDIKISKIMSRNEEKLDERFPIMFGPDIPSVSDLKNNIDMIFLNINPIWEGNFPVPPGVVYMGGLHMKPPKELPEDLQNYLDASKEGLIYFSLGSNVKPSLLPPEKIAIFEKVFSELPYNVIWKWDNKNFTVKSSNIRIFQWLPQADLLRHPNVKLFITQGGLQSTDEAILGGVPLIGMPMLGDQWFNVEKYVHHKIGVRLDMEELTEEKLKVAILEVAEGERYRNNIKRLRSIIHDQPQKPLERAVWWIGYVLRHGGAKHLRSPAANMSWAEFLELKLLCAILLATLVSTGIVFAAAKITISCLKNNLLVKKLKKL